MYSDFVKVSNARVLGLLILTVLVAYPTHSTYAGVPTFTSTPVTGAAEDTVYTYNITASDPESDPLQIETAIDALDQGQTVDQSATTQSNIWQSFTVGISGPLNKIRLKTGSGFSVTLKIYAGEGTGGTLLHTQSVSGGAGWNTFTLTTPVQVTAGNQYTFFIGSATVRYAATNPYSGGKSSIADHIDLVFETFVCTPDGGASLPGWLTLVDNGNGTGTLTGTPTQADVGNYSLKLIVSDATGADTQPFTISVSAVNDAPVITVPGAQNVNEDTDLPLFGISIADDDVGSNPLQVTLSATNGTLSLNQTAELSFIIGDGISDPTMTFTGNLSDINNALDTTDPLIYRGSENYSGPDTITLTANDQGYTGSGGIQTDIKIIAVTVNAVADAPVLTAADASGGEDSTIGLGITATLVDTDGSENLEIVISDVPTGATLSAGTDNGDGSWTLTAAELTGLALSPPAHSDNDFTLTVAATATEAVNGNSASTVDNVNVTLNAVADAPTLTVQDAVGDEDTAIPLNISAGLVDTDGSEILEIVISNVPQSVSLSAGTDNGDGSWTLTPAQLAGLTLTPPTHSDTDFTLTVTAATTEAANGDSASTVDSINVRSYAGVCDAYG